MFVSSIGYIVVTTPKPEQDVGRMDAEKSLPNGGPLTAPTAPQVTDAVPSICRERWADPENPSPSRARRGQVFSMWFGFGICLVGVQLSCHRIIFLPPHRSLGLHLPWGRSGPPLGLHIWVALETTLRASQGSSPTRMAAPNLNKLYETQSSFMTAKW